MSSNISNCKILPTDFTDYGGNIERLSRHSDCSCECGQWTPLFDRARRSWDTDFGICLQEHGERRGLLTFEHQAGASSFESYPEADNVIARSSNVTDADCISLSSDYADYGGTIVRYATSEQSPVCAWSCTYFAGLYDHKSRTEQTDYGVCLNTNSPRHGLLTYKLQAGLGCYVKNKHI
jgi:hypothetical protein